MPEGASNSKRPPKRFEPKGLAIIFEDKELLVVDKVSGLLTVGTDKEKENTAYSLLNKYVKKGNLKSPNRVYIVHRLDRDTSGLIVFAKTDRAKNFLQEEWQGFEKKYFAVVCGVSLKKEDVITTYLTENTVYKVYSTEDAKLGKLAMTGYKVLQESKICSLLEVDLLTGRKNQIRAHFSERGFPLVGDNKYGNKEPGINRLALHSAHLTLIHPTTKQEMVFKSEMPKYFKFLLSRRAVNNQGAQRAT